MTDRQPEALRLAKILEDHYFYVDTNEAAAELHRLHAENEYFRATCDRLNAETSDLLDEIAALRELRDELLKALEKIIEMNRMTARDQFGDREQAERWACVTVARAAIAKTGGAA